MLMAQSPSIETMAHHVLYLRKREEIMSRSYAPEIRNDLIEFQARNAGMTVEEYRNSLAMKNVERDLRASAIEELDREFGYSREEEEITDSSSIRDKYLSKLKKLESETKSVKKQMEMQSIFALDLSNVPREEDGAE